MIFLMYSKDNCPWCEKAKDFLLSPQRQTKNELFIINVSELNDDQVQKIRENLSDYIPLPDKLTVPQIFRINSLAIPTNHFKDQFPFTLFERQVGSLESVDHFWTISHIGGYTELEKYMEGR